MDGGHFPGYEVVSWLCPHEDAQDSQRLLLPCGSMRYCFTPVDISCNASGWRAVSSHRATLLHRGSSAWEVHM